MKVSIITVCFNSDKTIEKTIQSVISQKYKNIEYIIIDGNSSDNTSKIISKYSEYISKYISEPDAGIYDAMNKGINCAEGDVVAILNSDDFYTDKNVISDVVELFTNQKVDIVYGDIEYFNQSHEDTIVRVWVAGEYKRGSFVRGWHPPHPAFFAKKSMYNKYGGFDISLNISADFDLMLRFMDFNKAFSLYLNRSLVQMCAGGESGKSIKNIFIGNMNILKSFRKYNMKVNPLLYLLRRLLPKVIASIQLKIKRTK